MLEELKAQVCAANRDLVRHNLVFLTWGNVSGIDRGQGLVVIKPSGKDYGDLNPDDMTVVDLHGKVVEGTLRPSTDTPTHLALYRAFAAIGGVTHTHSTYATIFAQACRPIPVLGTTHADQFRGEVPVTRSMNKREVMIAYEVNTGTVIAERFAKMNPLDMPAVLVAHHGPFTWGKNAASALISSATLEEVARMAYGTLTLNPQSPPIADFLLDKHFLRKHGAQAYYGQAPR